MTVKNNVENVVVPSHHMTRVIYRKYSLDHTEDCEMLDPVYLAVRKIHFKHDQFG